MEVTNNKKKIMKHKVGDVVKVKSLAWYEENKDGHGDIALRSSNTSKIIFNSIMANFCGKKVTIKKELCYKYLIEEDGHGWFFTDAMFEEPSRQLVITDEKAKELYKTASAEFKSVLEETFGKDFFVEDIRDKVKTIPDSIRIYRINHSDVAGITVYLSKGHTRYVRAFISALAIAEALNEGWEPDWNSSDAKYKIVSYRNNIQSTYDNSQNNGMIYFKSKELAEYFIKQFPDICKTLYGGTK